jgi:hypothetical protein
LQNDRSLNGVVQLHDLHWINGLSEYKFTGAHQRLRLLFGKTAFDIAETPRVYFGVNKQGLLSASMHKKRQRPLIIAFGYKISITE